MGKAVSRTPDMHVGGVGRSRSTDEGPERGRPRARGGSGGKATDQGEHRAVDRAPDPEPDKRVEGVGGCAGSRTRDKRTRFTALLHHVTVPQLRASFDALKREAAPGVDGVTWTAYEKDLDTRLAALDGRCIRDLSCAAIAAGLHPESGRAAAPAGHRGAGRQDRPAGRGDCPQPDLRGGFSGLLVWVSAETQSASSAGCAVGRAHAEAGELGARRGHPWFFDTIDHDWLMKFVEHRIADRRILRLIQKWLRAGVSEEGEWRRQR